MERDVDYQRIHTEGRYQQNKDGIMVDAPWSRRWERLGGLLVKYFVRLGLSPTDRQRIIGNLSRTNVVEQSDGGDTGLEDV